MRAPTYKSFGGIIYMNIEPRMFEAVFHKKSGGRIPKLEPPKQEDRVGVRDLCLDYFFTHFIVHM